MLTRLSDFYFLLNQFGLQEFLRFHHINPIKIQNCKCLYHFHVCSETNGHLVWMTDVYIICLAYFYKGVIMYVVTTMAIPELPE